MESLLSELTMSIVSPAAAQHQRQGFITTVPSGLAAGPPNKTMATIKGENLRVMVGDDIRTTSNDRASHQLHAALRPCRCKRTQPRTPLTTGLNKSPSALIGTSKHSSSATTTRNRPQEHRPPGWPHRPYRRRNRTAEMQFTGFAILRPANRIRNHRPTTGRIKSIVVNKRNYEQSTSTEDPNALPQQRRVRIASAVFRTRQNRLGTLCGAYKKTRQQDILYNWGP